LQSFRGVSPHSRTHGIQIAMNLTLWSLKAGQRCEILGFDQSLAENYRTRMMEFGFHPGERVSCLQSLAFGAPKVYRVSNTIFSLDQEVASHLQVRLLDQHE
jgi:Fe2+ transport system protein FeoA